MLYRYSRRRPDAAPPPTRLGDHVLSVLLPALVIGLNAALSLGLTGGFDAFVGLCYAVVGGR